MNAPTLDACEDALNLARTVALNLADCDIPYGGTDYYVASVDNDALFDEQQLEEANVFSNMLVLEYIGAGTRG